MATILAVAHQFALSVADIFLGGARPTSGATEGADKTGLDSDSATDVTAALTKKTLQQTATAMGMRKMPLPFCDYWHSISWINFTPCGHCCNRWGLVQLTASSHNKVGDVNNLNLQKRFDRNEMVKTR